MIKCQDLIEKIEERYPRIYACDWDNTGLLAGDREQEIQSVYIALDATDRVIDRGGSACDPSSHDFRKHQIRYHG